MRMVRITWLIEKDAASFLAFVTVKSLDQLLASRINQDAGLSCVGSETDVYEIQSVKHRMRPTSPNLSAPYSQVLRLGARICAAPCPASERIEQDR
jgi:hypothetical protein